MKKLIRIPLLIVLLLGGAFLYVVNTPTSPFSQQVLKTLGINIPNTDTLPIDLNNCSSYFDGCNTCMVQSGQIGGCTKMFCETPSEPKCLEYVYTGIDLTNCISYFDGCNNCTVENGKPSACTLMYCETPGEPKCNEYATGTTTRLDLSKCESYFDGCNTCTVKDGQPEACTEMYCETPSEPKCLVFASGADTTSLANPASVNCTDKGGTLNIVTQSDGSQIGMCTLANGDICEERAYMRGTCGISQEGQTSPSSPGNEEEVTMCTMQYEPVCASVAVQCIKAPCPAVKQTFGNACMMQANKLATFLYTGECIDK
ncbi:MAG TPA: DUF333 domain-containing protein [Candidatus Absconditabacterales bacterium]|nr:DUF333 domain-containing protein [Candidatus Absconditabacterales bacterium]